MKARNTSNTPKEIFWKWYDEYSDKIFRFCLIKTSSRDIALDITQEVFVKAWKYILNGGEIKSPQAFLFRIARNLVIDFYRKRKDDSVDRIEDVAETIIDDGNLLADASDKYDLSLVVKILNELGEDDSDILIMRLVEGMDNASIAEAVGKTPNHVAVKIHRLTKKVKEVLRKKDMKIKNVGK